MRRSSPAPNPLTADFSRVDWSRFDAATGLRAAFFALTPMVLGIATNQLNAGVISSIGALNEGVISALGALNLNFQEGPAPSRTRLVASLTVGCLANAVAFSLGTVIGTTSTVVAAPLVALGVFLAMLIRLGPGLESVGPTVAAVFTVGVGLPGGSVEAAGARFWLMLAGGAWALLGGVLQWWLGRASPPAGPVGAAQAPPRSSILLHSLAVGVTAALGLGVAQMAGLSRDYWVMFTVVLSLRATPAQTASFTFMRIAGTVAGAIVALVVTLGTGNVLALFAFLCVFSFLMFATRSVNLVVFVFFLTAFIIILLNIAYPGSWDLALVRIVDVAIGGGLSLAASAVMWLASAKSRSQHKV